MYKMSTNLFTNKLLYNATDAFDSIVEASNVIECQVALITYKTNIESVAANGNPYDKISKQNNGKAKTAKFCYVFNICEPISMYIRSPSVAGMADS